VHGPHEGTGIHGSEGCELGHEGRWPGPRVKVH
jgi:hypothetical protein